MKQNFPKLITCIKLQIQKVQRTPKSTNMNKHTEAYHIQTTKNKVRGNIESRQKKTLLHNTLYTEEILQHTSCQKE